MSDEHLRKFVSEWKEHLLSVKRGEANLDVFYAKVMDKNCEFSSPAIHKPSTNPMYVSTILKWIVEIVEDFHYKDIDYYDGKTNRVAMMFGGKIKDPKSGKYRNVEGIDLIKLDPSGRKVVELKVMIRPLNALILVATTMKNRFKRMSNL